MQLPQAIHKITGRPAERFNLRHRGQLSPGYYADVVVFDSATVGSPATYENPERTPDGIRLVLREGRPSFPPTA